MDKKIIKTKILKFLKRLFSCYPEEKALDKDSLENFIMSLKVTSVCKFNASLRISLINKSAFITTTIFSLGLILIPLLQMIVKKQVFNNITYGVVQIFLAVSVLVYSTIIGTAKYDLRAAELDRCGVDIKNLIRNIRANKEHDINMEEYTDKYHDIIKNCENHTRSDFKKAKLQLTEYFRITGIKKILFWIEIVGRELIPYIAPLILILLEVLFILDLLSITNVFEVFK